MSRPRVLCVSSDRSTRASVTLALTDVPVNVVIAQRTSEAVDRLEQGPIDAVVIDASTIANVPRLVDVVESEAPSTPTFVHWGDDESDASVAVLSEVVARADETDPPDRLADAITERVGADSRPTPGDLEASDTAAVSDAIASLPDDLAAIVSAVKRRLVDVTSPVAVERILREEFTATDRFAFAWVGEYDQGEGEIVPWLTDPDSMEWPMQRTFPIGDGDQPLLERAIRTDGLQTHRQIADRRDVVPFGQHAIERGVRSVAVAPLASADERYGVFVVYALETLSEAERTAIRTVAETASHVLETIAIRGRLEQRERALQRYERLVETAGDGMYVLDERGHFMTVNDALTAMTGYSREGLLGEHASIVFDEDDIESGREIIRSLLDSDASTDTAELTLETKSGERIPSEVQIAVLVHDGEFVGSVGVVRDITERKRSERKLREQNERLDAFARIVSHDLRNPLSVAQGYLDLLDETESLEYAANVRDGLDRMEAIIEDVLAIARDGEWATETEPVDLESVADDAWEYVSTADATLTVTRSTTVEADRSRLLRLLENLFRNAVEHGSTNSPSQARENSVEHGSTSSRPKADDSVEHGSTGNRRGSRAADSATEDTGTGITVRVGMLESDGDGDEDDNGDSDGDGDEDDGDGTGNPRGFFVEDDGTGLPDEIRDELFDPSVSTSSEGLGIGLWVVREVATGHGWSVTATESADGGARFEFAFDDESAGRG